MPPKTMLPLIGFLRVAQKPPKRLIKHLARALRLIATKPDWCIGNQRLGKIISETANIIICRPAFTFGTTFANLFFSIPCNPARLNNSLVTFKWMGESHD
ncbi:MAG: hypothetical protein SFX18_11025 [Pirellulales bacterium]|nr:hypothetical protein [Pirellulales bacterium]